MTRNLVPRALIVAVLVLLASPIGVAADAPGKNDCGCRQDSAGTCFCDRGARCGCPGECEPRGCVEKRDKQLQKKLECETKKANTEISKHPKEAPNSATTTEAVVTYTGSKRQGLHHLTPKSASELGRC